MTQPMIETRGLSKTFGNKKAVDELSLIIPSGTVFGFLGSNGAGKTTTIRMIMGHLHSTEGEVEVFGQNPWLLAESDRQRIAYVSENMHIPGWMTPEAAIQFNASFYPRWNRKRAEQLLKRFDLKEAGRYGNLSKGQKRAVCLLLALCADADLLVLDEPASGLDVAARRSFLDAVLEHVYDTDRTVFFSSHILSDLERVVDHVAILKKGHLLLSGGLDALKEGYKRIQIRKQITREELEKHFRVTRYVRRRDGIEATIGNFTEAIMPQFCAAVGLETPPEITGMNLEDLFVETVQEEQEEQGDGMNTADAQKGAVA